MRKIHWFQSLVIASGVGATTLLGGNALAQQPGGGFRPGQTPNAPVPGLNEHFQTTPQAGEQARPGQPAGAGTNRVEAQRVDPTDRAGSPYMSVRGSQLIGLQLHDSAGNPLGSIQDFVLDQSGNVAYLTADFTGQGFAPGWSYVLPFQAVTFQNGSAGGPMAGRVALDHNQLLKAPAFRTSEWPNFGNQQVLGSIQQFWQGAGFQNVNAVGNNSNPAGGVGQSGATGINANEAALDQRLQSAAQRSGVAGSGGVDSARPIPGAGALLPGQGSTLPGSARATGASGIGASGVTPGARNRTGVGVGSGVGTGGTVGNPLGAGTGSGAATGSGNAAGAGAAGAGSGGAGAGGAGSGGAGAAGAGSGGAGTGGAGAAGAGSGGAGSGGAGGGAGGSGS